MSDTKASVVNGIPPLQPRTIVLCFDGTRGKYGIKNSNIVKFFDVLNKNSPDRQVVYYQPGVGMYYAPGIVSPLLTFWAMILDEAFAWYLNDHVMDGYKFLMDNYRTGDKICLFGFSRGAYTARALVAMLYRVGLLPRDNLQQVNLAFETYQRHDEEGAKLAAGFKRTFSQDVYVDFVGVWDTVQSTGVLFSHELPFTDSDKAVRVFRHALSLDEHRSRFRPNLHHWPHPKTFDEPTNIIWPLSLLHQLFHAFQSILKLVFGSKGETEDSDGAGVHTMTADVREVWFAGTHRDVGGGNVNDGVNVSLAQIPLRWMVEQVIQSQCGILFDGDALKRTGLLAKDDNGSGQHALNPQELPEAADSMAPIFDDLASPKLWIVAGCGTGNGALIWAGVVAFTSGNRHIITR